jgi:asparagine synthase (glutamine-hydrolysing)
MCGLVGIYNLKGQPVAPVLLRAMTQQLQHRGPDSEGYCIEGFLGLGHRRLSILDLSLNGHQPMTSDDGNYTIAYNGEVYNFAEIRKKLVNKGVKFRSTSDTEVILYAFREYGVGCLNMFNGMLAFAIWDRRHLRLTIARDRYGIKPLYYTLSGESFLVSSEIKGFFPHPHFTPEMDHPGLAEYLTFQNFFSDKTLFKGVKLLSPGSYLTIQLGDTELPEPVTYWDWNFEQDLSLTDEQACVEQLDNLITQAVKRQLVSDVEVGCFLSGGIDSGLIVGKAAGELNNLRTFTTGFDLHSVSGMELYSDEREAAEQLSYLFRTLQYETVVKAGDMQRVLSKLVWHLEEPRVGQSFPNFHTANLTSKFVKVALSGLGGDELFGGYPWRYYRAVVNIDFNQYIQKYFEFWQRLLPVSTVHKLMLPHIPGLSEDFALSTFRGVFRSSFAGMQTAEDYVNHSLYFEAKTFLHGLMLLEDKLGMAHGLETRVPFLDNDVVDFACRVPVRFKLGNLGAVVTLNENEPGPKTKRYFEKTQDGKLLMRKVMERMVPHDIAHRAKQGFSSPDGSWFRGESINYVKERLIAGNPRIYDILDRSILEPLINDHLDGRENRRLLLWSLLYLESWCEQFLGRTREQLMTGSCS